MGQGPQKPTSTRPLPLQKYVPPKSGDVCLTTEVRPHSLGYALSNLQFQEGRLVFDLQVSQPPACVAVCQKLRLTNRDLQIDPRFSAQSRESLLLKAPGRQSLALPEALDSLPFQRVGESGDQTMVDWELALLVSPQPLADRFESDTLIYCVHPKKGTPIRTFAFVAGESYVIQDIFGLAHQDTCLICLDAPPTIICLPCRHSTMCPPCSQHLRQLSQHSQDARCLMCRQPVLETLEIQKALASQDEPNSEAGPT